MGSKNILLAQRRSGGTESYIVFKYLACSEVGECLQGHAAWSNRGVVTQARLSSLGRVDTLRWLRNRHVRSCWCLSSLKILTSFNSLS